MREDNLITPRSEEIQDIIDRMPTSFGIKVTTIVVVLLLFGAFFGWIIEYPDVVSGEITINSQTPPVKLIANTNGVLLLNHYKSLDSIREGDYVAVIKNPAKVQDVQKVSRLISLFNLSNDDISSHVSHFPRNVSLGELDSKYFSFLSAFEEYVSFHTQNLFNKQEELLKKNLEEQRNVHAIFLKKRKIGNDNLRLIGKMNKRDSILLSQKIISEADYDKTQIHVLSVEDSYHNTLNEIARIEDQIQGITNKLQQTAIQRNEKEQQVRLNLIAAHSTLIDDFKAWEQKYVFKSPINGRVQFLKFLRDNQFILAGDECFTIIPGQSRFMGQMSLPSHGAGKVKVGQEVIIKLQDYPYKEYGSIKGKVKSISLASNTLKTNEGNLEYYLVNIELPEQLKTNYGTKLEPKLDIKGLADIVTKPRKLYQRFFDNLKYQLNT